MKSFGGGRKSEKTLPFELVAYDDDEERAFQFTARPAALTADMLQMVRSAGRKDADDINIERIIPMMRKLIVNNDGLVKAGWEPTPVDADDERRLAYPESAMDDPMVEGPDGHLYFADDQDMRTKWADPSNWTSRRRWVELIEKDDNLLVYAEDLMGVMKWLVAEAGQRPTRPRT